MRKILLSVVACCAVIAFVPASALAHGHHKRHHRAHHARVRDFGSTTSSSSGSSGSSGSSQDQPAGTIQSISGNVLTIALTGGGTVTGTVTGDTEIECQAADMSGSSSWQGHDHGGDNNSTGSGDNSQGDDDQGQGDDDNNNAGQTCDTSSLTTGAVVQEAELRITSAGAVWKKIDLASSSTSSSGSSSSSSGS